ncbi:MAG: hypothetical protein E6G97_06295 [Alphaproteobacteria bacterium]|nr:MAG: hypothetical protein E6G97_06295 [Alphaproteobacteria bacterium]
MLLAGCGPKPLPEWAMSGQVERVTIARSKTARIIETGLTDRGPPPSRTSIQPQAELLPFTPEWQAREEAFDNRLRRTMNICRGC